MRTNSPKMHLWDRVLHLFKWKEEGQMVPKLVAQGSEVDSLENEFLTHQGFDGANSIQVEELEEVVFVHEWGETMARGAAENGGKDSKVPLQVDRRLPNFERRVPHHERRSGDRRH